MMVIVFLVVTLSAIIAQIAGFYVDSTCSTYQGGSTDMTCTRCLQTAYRSYKYPGESRVRYFGCVWDYDAVKCRTYDDAFRDYVCADNIDAVGSSSKWRPDFKLVDVHLEPHYCRGGLIADAPKQSSITVEEGYGTPCDEEMYQRLLSEKVTEASDNEAKGGVNASIIIGVIIGCLLCACCGAFIYWLNKEQGGTWNGRTTHFYQSARPKSPNLNSPNPADTERKKVRKEVTTRTSCSYCNGRGQEWLPLGASCGVETIECGWVSCSSCSGKGYKEEISYKEEYE